MITRLIIFTMSNTCMHTFCAVISRLTLYAKLKNIKITLSILTLQSNFTKRMEIRLFFFLLSLQKSPFHPGSQLKQAPFALHIGSGQWSVHGLLQLLP